MSEFIEHSPTLDNYWRSIILFGRNVASYKFALAKSLLEFRDRGNDLITMVELAEPFSRHLCEHLGSNPRQGTFASSRFLEACKNFNAGETSTDELTATTVRIGFNNVIDAFHVVNQCEIAKRFFLDERRLNNGIRLTDEMYGLFDDRQSLSLNQEVEARWRLVETSWELGVSRNLLSMEFEPETQLIITSPGKRRISVTVIPPKISGVQK